MLDRYIFDKSILSLRLRQERISENERIKKQNIPYCFTENEYETKLNYLIKKKECVLEISGVHRIPYFINETGDKRIFLNNILYKDEYKYLWVGRGTLERDIEECKSKRYRFTIQENLVKEIDYGF